ncbi:mitochondrial import receptor subunit TOM40B [Pelobates cultripes]|uniref:Mitochondrial import receptor subunit TOM40B n=1 Tax=Pelobates cultripes TaxID=61616 RepID=A0AAD1WU95_PELCU|nr:mitochondrial import receptor subunit TOM40B [Pelobates cultripes]
MAALDLFWDPDYPGPVSPGRTSKYLTWQFDGEYRGDDCTVSITLGNPDILNESVILVSHFLQSITTWLVLGGELVYHKRRGEEGAIVTLAGKYSAPNWEATLNIGYGGAHASYYQKANEQVQVGVEFEANTRFQEMSFAFSYPLNTPKSNMVFKASVDSSWCVGGSPRKETISSTCYSGSWGFHESLEEYVSLWFQYLGRVSWFKAD